MVMHRLFVSSSVLWFVLACGAEGVPPSAPPTPTSTGTGAQPPLSAAPVIAEPPGIGANKLTPPAAPSGKGVWVVDGSSSSVKATVGPKSEKPLVLTFRGAGGALDGESGKGVFTVDLTTAESRDLAGNPDVKRDAAIVEGFFAARSTQNANVTAAWQQLTGKLATGVGRATLVVDKVPIGVSMIVSPPAKVNPEYVEKSTVNGRLLLWNSVEVPLEIPVAASRKGDVLEVKTDQPATFNVARATGSAIRNTLSDAMAAAGYEGGRAVGSEVSVTMRIVMKLQP